MTTYDAAVVGGGPAGLAAGAMLAKRGLRVALYDEFPILGGRLLGQSYRLADGRVFDGAEEARRLTTSARDAGVQACCGTSLVDARRSDGGIFELRVLRHGERSLLRVCAKSLVVATGAGEVGVAVPGWTLPGVLTVGAAQVLTRVYGISPGKRGLIIGIGALSLVIALELIESGTEIAAIVSAPSLFVEAGGARARVLRELGRLAHLTPGALGRFGRALRSPAISSLTAALLPSAGVRVAALPLRPGMTVAALNGAARVQSADLAPLRSDGRPGKIRERLQIDFVLVSGGLSPLTEVAELAGAACVTLPPLGGRVPLHDATLRTNVPGLYVAGNVCGIEGAPVAMAQGALAAASCLEDMGLVDARARQEAADELTRRRAEAPLVFYEGAGAARERLYALQREAASS